ncbi:MAG: FHA domain-containing protein [Candidatus Acidiferrum sp.]
MGILLEIKAGPLAGKKISIVTGQTLTFGRAEGRAEIALPHDTFMSGVHFAVECGPQGCRVQDRKSSNGTFLNGARIKDAMLANGDEIKGGQTVFSVKIVPDAKLASEAPSVRAAPPVPVAPPAQEPKLLAVKPELAKAVPRPPPPAPSAPAAQSSASQSASPAAAIPKPSAPVVPVDARAGERPSVFSVKGWSFAALPEKWEIQQEFGLQRNAAGEFPSSVLATEEFLGGITLQEFVEAQISMLRRYLRDPKIEPVMPPQVSGAEETMAVDVRHATKDGKELVYRRIYARSGVSVGVLSVTTLAADFARILESLQPLLNGVSFLSAANK